MLVDFKDSVYVDTSTNMTHWCPIMSHWTRLDHLWQKTRTTQAPVTLIKY